MSIAEFAEFARLHLRGLSGDARLLPEGVFRRMHAPVTPDGDAGIGWGLQPYRGGRASTHAGSAETFYAVVAVLPPVGVAVVAAANAQTPAAREAVMEALDLVREHAA